MNVLLLGADGFLGRHLQIALETAGHTVLGLYGLAGAAWLPVVWLQVRMRDLARSTSVPCCP